MRQLKDIFRSMAVRQFEDILRSMIVRQFKDILTSSIVSVGPVIVTLHGQILSKNGRIVRPAEDSLLPCSGHRLSTCQYLSKSLSPAVTLLDSEL